ncbi:MAG: RagB/SusD family nutrient uptake outer membrane protein, partial [Bacteroidales bacterium]|nr:RagB/SusD family nutrient uptake outer membrane protein [Bacteroidales bacterium]
MKNILYILLALFMLTSCEDFLDEKPDKSKQEIELVSDIDLMFEATQYGYLDDISFVNTTGDIQYSKAYFETLGGGPYIEFTNVQESVWKDEISTSTDHLWNQAYEAIWFTNYVIGNIDDLEGDAADKQNLKAEAHLVKAYKQFNLALKHCLYPSANNKDELGIIIKDETEFGQTTVRATLEETFAQIESDIIKGLEIDKPRTDSWRESDASAAALAARYYLYVQDFANAKKYAEMALSLHNTMIDLNTIDLINYLGQDMTADIFTASYSPEYYTCWESSYKMYHNKSQSIMVANDE